MKKSRVKYSKSNKHFSQLVLNVDRAKQLKMHYNNLQEKRLNVLTLNHAEIEKINGNENIFIETEELYNFFSLTEINRQSDIAQQVYYSLKNRKYIDEIYTKSNGNTPYRIYVFRLFAPINKISTSLAICISCTQTYNEGLGLNYITFTDHNSSQELLLYKDSIENLKNGNIITNNNITENEYSNKIYEYYRVIMNLIFYMNAYPENVINGVPQKAVLDENVKISDKKITISKNAILFENYEKSPHLRRGHWRTFTSDYFTNKQGETIWIDPAYIKGEAYTVIEGKNNVKSIQ